MSHVEFLLGLALGFISLITAVVGFLAWYRVKVADAVERKRDFGHLKNNYQQLATNTEQLWRQLDERFDRVERQLDRMDAKLTPDKTVPM